MFRQTDPVHHFNRWTYDSQHTTGRIQLRQIALLNSTQGFRRSRITGQNNQLATFGEQLHHSLPGKPVYYLKRARPIRSPGIVAEVNIIVVRHCLTDLIKYGKSSIAGIKDPDRTRLL